jgi:hydrogen peroxide-dependent heme synthase
VEQGQASFPFSESVQRGLGRPNQRTKKVMTAAIPPATLEGWYALHQVYALDWGAVAALENGAREDLARDADTLFSRLARPEAGGWSAAYRLAGGGADVLFVHFRPTLDELSAAELEVKRSLLARHARLTYDFLSVTEAGLYHATAETAREHEPRSAAFDRELAIRAEEELQSSHVQTRLYPQIPDGMRYVSFYPMSKRRAPGQNWYTLPVDERSRLMRDHGLTGRRYARRIFQVISGSLGLDEWEWGVTLYARDPLEFKRIVTEMRYDEASAVFSDFGRFFTGIHVEPDEWLDILGGSASAA